MKEFEEKEEAATEEMRRDTENWRILEKEKNKQIRKEILEL